MTMKAVSTVPSGIDAGVGLVVALYWLAILLPLVIFDSAALLAKGTVEERRNRHSDVPLMSTTIELERSNNMQVWFCRSGKRGQARHVKHVSGAVGSGPTLPGLGAGAGRGPTFSRLDQLIKLLVTIPT